MAEPDSNIFSWDGLIVSIPPGALEGIVKRCARNTTWLNEHLSAAEKSGEEKTVFRELNLFGKWLAFLVACFKSEVHMPMLNYPSTVAVYKGRGVFMEQAGAGGEYSVVDVGAKFHGPKMSTTGFPNLKYDENTPENVNDFMDGFFFGDVKKLINPINDALSKGALTIDQILEATNHSHRRYFVFGYLMRRALYDKDVQYRLDGIKVFWRMK